jgi:hypothetical protein
MSLFPARSRRAVPALVAALALGVAGCGESDVESGVSQGTKKAKDAASEAEKRGKDAASQAEKRAKQAKKDAER